MYRTMVLALLAALTLVGFAPLASAGVVSTTHATHTFTLDSVTGVAPGDFVIESELAFVGGGAVDLFAVGEGATDASGTVTVAGMEIDDPFEIPSLDEGDSFVAELTAVAERFSDGISEASAFATYRMTFENTSAAHATFTLSYTAEVRASVTGADTILDTREGLSDGIAMLVDDGDLVGSPFVLAPTFLGSAKSISNGALVDSLFDGNASTLGTIAESFAFTVAPGEKATFTIDAAAYAQAIATVPEPGSVVIWSAGLLLMVRRKRRA